MKVRATAPRAASPSASLSSSAGAQAADPAGRPGGPVEATEASQAARLQPPGDRRALVSGTAVSIAPLRPPHVPRKGPRAWPGGRRGDPAGGAHKTPRLRGTSRPRAVLRGLHPSRLLTAARGKRRRTEGSAQPAGLTGLGQSLRPLSAAARHRGRGPGSRHRAGHATATDASARPAAQPPRRPAAAAELSPPLCSAPPSPPLPPPRPALPPEPPPSRRPAPLGPQPATGAGGGGDAGRRLLLPAISSLLPGSPRWLGAEGSGLEGRHVGGGFHHRKCLSARRGEAWRGSRGVARRLEALTAARTRSLARSLTHRVSSARRRRGACGAAEDARRGEVDVPH